MKHLDPTIDKLWFVTFVVDGRQRHVGPMTRAQARGKCEAFRARLGPESSPDDRAYIVPAKSIENLVFG